MSFSFIILILYLLYTIFQKFMGGEQQGRGGGSRFQNNYSYEQDRVSPLSFEVNLLSLCTLVIRANGVVTQAELDFVRNQFVQLYGKERANLVFRTFKDLTDLLVKYRIPIRRQAILGGIGLILDKFPYSQAPTQPVSFIFVARLLREKGVFEFLQAAERFDGDKVNERLFKMIEN